MEYTVVFLICKLVAVDIRIRKISLEGKNDVCFPLILELP